MGDGIEGKRAELEVDLCGRRDRLSREDESVAHAAGDTTLEADEEWWRERSLQGDCGGTV